MGIISGILNFFKNTNKEDAINKAISAPGVDTRDIQPKLSLPSIEQIASQKAAQDAAKTAARQNAFDLAVGSPKTSLSLPSVTQNVERTPSGGLAATGTTIEPLKLQSRPDFLQLAEKGRSIADKPLFKLSPLAGMQNKVEYALRQGGGVLGDISKSYIGSQNIYQYMTENQRNIYNAYLGMGDRAGAEVYLKSIEGGLKQQAGQVLSKAVDVDNPLMTTALGFDEGVKSVAGISQWFNDEARQKSPQEIAFENIRPELSGVQGVAADLAQTTGFMLPAATFSAATGGAGLAPVVAQGISAGLFGAAAGGNAYADALNSGKDQEDAKLYGIINGALEGGLQFALGGIGAFGGGAISKGIGKTVLGKSITSKISNVVSALSKTPALQNLYRGLVTSGKYGARMSEEAFEEWLQSVLDPVVRNQVLDENNKITFFSEQNLYSALLGALGAGVMNIASVPSMYQETGRDITNKTFSNTIEKYQKSPDLKRENQVSEAWEKYINPEGERAVLRLKTADMEKELSNMKKTFKPYGINDIQWDYRLTGKEAMIAGDTIYVSPDIKTAEALEYKVIHEVAHAAARIDENLVNDTLSLMQELGIDTQPIVMQTMENYQRFMNEKGKDIEVNEQYASEEVFADFVAMLEENADIRQHLSKANPNLLQRILRYIEELISRMRGMSVEEIQVKKYQDLAKDLRGFITEQTGQEIGEGQYNNQLAAGGKKYSISDVNSEGQKLTQQQAEFFKDSKVRDKFGRLMVVYHGSPKEFTKFDTDKIGKRGSFLSSRLGFYFTEEQEYAEVMGNSPEGKHLYAVYLNIKNPLRILSTELFKEEEVSQVEEMLKGGDYDGIIDKMGNYVAFEPSQIKSVDNLNPTSNPDIRYSISDTQDTEGIDSVKSEMRRQMDRNAGNLIEANYLADLMLPYAKDYSENVTNKLQIGDEIVFPKAYFDKRTFLKYDIVTGIVKDMTEKTVTISNNEGQTQKHRLSTINKYGVFAKPRVDRVEQAETRTPQTDLLLPTKTEAAKASEQEIIEATTKQTLTKVPQEKKPTKEAIKDTISTSYRALVDALGEIDKLGKAIGDKYMYSYANNARVASHRAQYMIDGRNQYGGGWGAQVDVEGNKVGKSLAEIFAPIKAQGDDYLNQFYNYLLHYLNVDRMSLGNNKTVAVSEATRALEQFENEHPGIVELKGKERSKALTGEDTLIRDLVIEHNRLNTEIENASKIKNKTVFGDDVTAEISRLAVAGHETRHPEFKNFAQEVYDYNNNLLDYRVQAGLISQKDADFLRERYPHYVPVHYLNEGETQFKDGKNVKVAQTVKTAKGGYTDILPIDVAMGRQTMAVVKAAADNMLGQRMYEAAQNNPDITSPYMEIETQPEDVTFDIDNENYELKDNTFTVYINGQAATMRVNKELFDGLKVLMPGKQEQSKFAELTYKAGVDKANTLFKQLVTSYSPIFLARNIIRDMQDVVMTSKDLSAFMKALPKAVNEIKSNGEMWQLYMSMGGYGNSFFNFSEGNTRDTTTKLSKFKDNTLGRVEALNMILEQIPRFTEFLATIEKGGRGYDNLMQAMHNAADVTVNFNRVGESVGFWNRTFAPFLNPSIQGFDRYRRLFTDKKSARMWVVLAVRAAAFGILPAILNRLLWEDDDKYGESYAIQTEWYKNTAYMFPISGEGIDTNWLKIPKGRLLSVIGGAADAVIDVAKGEDPELKEFALAAVSQTAPANPLESNLLRPIFRTKLFDKDAPGETWQGYNIENTRDMDKPASQRYDSSTDKLSIFLGKVTKLSPKKIQDIIESYSGVLGDVVLPLLTNKAERDPFSAAFVIDTTYSNTITNDFYDTLNEYTRTKNDPTATDKEKSQAALVERFLNKQKSGLTEVYTEIEEIQMSDIPDKEKREKVDALRSMINQTLLYATENVDMFAEEAGEMADRFGDDIDAAYLYANKNTFGAKYALQTYNKDVYEKAQKAYSQGIDYDTYFEYYFNTRGLAADKDENGEPITGSKKVKILNAINSLNIPSKQKDTLYYMNNYAASTIDEAPWHNGISTKYDITAGSGNKYGITANSGNKYGITANSGNKYGITAGSGNKYGITANSAGNKYGITANSAGNKYGITANSAGNKYGITAGSK